jgi:hypothetical protein
LTPQQAAGNYQVKKNALLLHASYTFAAAFELKNVSSSNGQAND